MSETAEVIVSENHPILLNFLRPRFFTHLDIENETIDVDEELPDDLLECVDLIQWMIFKGLFDKSFEYDEESFEYDEKDGEYLSIRLTLDEFLIERFFDNSDEEYLDQILEIFASILEDSGWDEVDYIFKLLSEEDEVSQEELAELKGDDPVTEICIELKLFHPEVGEMPIPLRKNLND